MVKVIQDLLMVAVYIDSILVAGRSDEEHLEKLLSHLQEYRLRLEREDAFSYNHWWNILATSLILKAYMQPLKKIFLGLANY